DDLLGHQSEEEHDADLVDRELNRVREGVVALRQQIRPRERDHAAERQDHERVDDEHREPESPALHQVPHSPAFGAMTWTTPESTIWPVRVTAWNVMSLPLISTSMNVQSASNPAADIADLR